jgi:hypothetical protein
MKEPTIVFCTTCKGRVQHLEQTLPRNLADQEGYRNCKFVVLDYGSQDGLLDYLKTNHSEAIRLGRVVVYSVNQTGPFHMAHAKNMAHRCGILEGADILVNLDADNFTEHGFAHYLSSILAKPNTFAWAKMIPSVLPRGISGRIAVSRHAFLNAGGYDEKYDTHGPDDKDFNERLRRLGYTGVEIDPGFLRAVNHNDRMRFREYPHAANAGEDTFHLQSTATIANFGNVGCGTVYKNFDFSHPIHLSPIPTRIFGIGMHKTATTSLHQALTILGFDSAHWKSAKWAKAIWNQMRNEGRSPVLEKHYALCDLPIPLLYKELDCAYPGSKFILTVRDPTKWLHSVKNHWDPELNRFRGQWDRDGFTHKIHQAVYGRREFDERVFLNRYRQHNMGALEYFKDRPEDLLVMDMDRDAEWYKLCIFLRQPVPGQAYPQAFATPRPHPYMEMRSPMSALMRSAILKEPIEPLTDIKKFGRWLRGLF